MGNFVQLKCGSLIGPPDNTPINHGLSHTNLNVICTHFLSEKFETIYHIQLTSQKYSEQFLLGNNIFLF